MYIFHNALKNLSRNKGRNILIAAIIFAIILTTVVALIINNTASAVIDRYKEQFNSEAIIRPQITGGNQGGGMGSSMGMRIIDAQFYLDLANWDGLGRADLTGSISVMSDSLNTVGDSSGQAFKLSGDNWNDFINTGMRALDSCEYPSKGECIISTDLRDANNVKLGETLSFTGVMSIGFPESMDPTNVKDDDIINVGGYDYIARVMITASGNIVQLSRVATFTLTVSGFYNDVNDDPSSRNDILTTLPTMLEQRASGETGISITARYYLNNPDDLAAFERYARAVGLPSDVTVGTDTASYNAIVEPVLGMKNITLVFMFVVLILGAIVLLLLMSISIRERKYEIGVLRAMGMKKLKVALGLWTEILAITCVCLVIGLGAGAVAAQPVSDIILKTQVSAAEANVPKDPMGNPLPDAFRGTTAKPLSEMPISLGLITILEIIGISLLLASVAGFISIRKITKYEPIKILMERN